MCLSGNRLILILALSFGFSARVGAQSTDYRITFVHSPHSSVTASPARHALPLVSSILSIQPKGDFHDGYRFRITENYKVQNAQSLFPFHETKTLFVTESRVPVAQIWGARLQVNFSAVTLHTRNVMLGPLASNDSSYRQWQLRSVDLYGVGVSVPLGRDARSEGSKSLWGTVSRLVHGDGWSQLSFSLPEGVGGLVSDCSPPLAGEEGAECSACRR